MAEPASPPIFVGMPGGRSRSERIPLEWPVSYAGKIYEAVTVRRMTLAEVRTFVHDLEKAAETTHLPIFSDDEGHLVPPIVLDALDPDDEENLDEAAARFLPRRFQAALGSGRGSQTGGGSAPT